MNLFKNAKRLAAPASLALLLSGGSGAAQAATIFGLTAGNRLVTFDSSSPGSLSTTLAVTGLASGQSLVGIDFRPSTGGLVGLARDAGTGQSQVYTLSSTGVATAIGGAFTLTGVAYGVDFNPVPDAFRVVSDAEENRRITMGGGGIVNSDTSLSRAGGGAADTTLSAVGAAYSNNVPGGIGGVTTLYLIDAAGGNVYTQGGINGPPSPNLGQLFLVGSLGLGTGLGDRIGFDILGAGTAYASVNNSFYSVNLGTGAATLIGAVGTGELLSDIAVAPVPEPATLSLIGLGLAGLAFVKRKK